MKPIRFHDSQIQKIISGQMSVDIRPAHKSLNTIAVTRKSQWFWVREKYFIYKGKVHYYPEPCKKDHDYKSDLKMPVEYCRLFICFDNRKLTRLFSLGSDWVNRFGFPNRNDFFNFWKQQYGLMNYSRNPYVWVYPFQRVEQTDFLSFISKYFKND